MSLRCSWALTKCTDIRFTVKRIDNDGDVYTLCPNCLHALRTNPKITWKNSEQTRWSVYELMGQIPKTANLHELIFGGEK